METSFSDKSSIQNGPPFELEEAIKMALKKTGATKEFDLCDFLSCEGRLISPSIYLRLRDTDQDTLLNLIWEQILNRDTHRSSYKAQESSAHSLYAGKSLEQCINEAMLKLNIARETALCKYIPCEVGYLHHFTFLKLKNSNPVQLRNMIKEHILDRLPVLVPPKKRHRRQRCEHVERQSIPKSAQRDSFEDLKCDSSAKVTGDEGKQKIFENLYLGSNKNGSENIQESNSSKLDQLVNLMNQLARSLSQDIHQDIPKGNQAGFNYRNNPELTLNRYLSFIQNQLIRKITMNQADEELWNIFVGLTQIKCHF